MHNDKNLRATLVLHSCLTFQALVNRQRLLAKGIFDRRLSCPQDHMG